MAVWALGNGVAGAQETCQHPLLENENPCGSDLSALTPFLSWWGCSLWSATGWGHHGTSDVFSSSASSGEGSVWAAEAANIYDESGGSWNDDELLKNVKASRIMRLWNWSSPWALKDEAAGFPWWPYMASSALRKGLCASQLGRIFSPMVSFGSNKRHYIFPQPWGLVFPMRCKHGQEPQAAVPPRLCLGCLYEFGVTHQVLTGWGVGPVLLSRREVVTWWENCLSVQSIKIMSWRSWMLERMGFGQCFSRNRVAGDFSAGENKFTGWEQQTGI